jgi:hypothetical protein
MMMAFIKTLDSESFHRKIEKSLLALPQVELEKI